MKMLDRIRRAIHRFFYVLGSGPVWEETFRIQAETRKIEAETAAIYREIDRCKP